jgi:predicted nucleic acid-binding protein
MNHKNDLKRIMADLQELRCNGADIRFVPESVGPFDICEPVPDYMQAHNLLSADALHLSFALAEAATLITFDRRDFRQVLDPTKNLTILLLTA